MTDIKAQLNQMAVWEQFKNSQERPARKELANGAKLIARAANRRVAYMAAMQEGGELEAIGELYTTLTSLEIPLTDDNDDNYTLDSITDKLESMFWEWLALATKAQNAAAMMFGYEMFKGGLPELPTTQDEGEDI